MPDEIEAALQKFIASVQKPGPSVHASSVERRREIVTNVCISGFIIYELERNPRPEREKLLFALMDLSAKIMEESHYHWTPREIRVASH